MTRGIKLWRELLLRCLPGGVMITLSYVSHGQEPTKTIPDGTEGETHGIIDNTTVKQKPFNQFDLGFTAFKIGIAFLYEYAWYSQDDIGKRQMDSPKATLNSGDDIRDIRFLLSGKLNTKRTITWKAGSMYAGSPDSWFARETGVMMSTVIVQ